MDGRRERRGFVLCVYVCACVCVNACVSESILGEGEGQGVSLSADTLSWNRGGEEED